VPVSGPFGRVVTNPEGAVMFNCPSNNRINRFAGAKVIGKGPRWRKGSLFDRGDKWRRPLDRNDRARVMVCAEALERRTKDKHKRDGVIGQSGLAVLRCLVNHFQNQARTNEWSISVAEGPLPCRTGTEVQ
jgi:hypothetical protein